MAVMAPEVTDLEQLWNESPPPCMMRRNDEECGNAATWLMMVVCLCNKWTKPACTECRDWIEGHLEVARKYYSQMACTVCDGPAEITWRPI